MAFKGSLETPDGATHNNALAVVADFRINYAEQWASVVLDVYHNQAAYDAGKRQIDRREYIWTQTGMPAFSDVFNADAVQLIMEAAKGDLTIFICALAATVDPVMAVWQQVTDSKPVKKKPAMAYSIAA